MLKTINNKQIYVNECDFLQLSNKIWINLKIIDDLPELEREAALIREIKGTNDTITLYNIDRSGWIVLELINDFNTIYGTFKTKQDKDVTMKNLEKFNVLDKFVLIEENKENYFWELNDKTACLNKKYTGCWTWKNQNKFLIGPGINRFHKSFLNFEENSINFDNLLNLMFMVKNAGPDFEHVLLENIKYLDRWTILDTGSTDGTQEVIKRVLGHLPGQLYEEPFVDFKVSRNRLIDLAGNKCKYNIMLDDSYIIQGDLRNFLNEIRGDQFGTSYSLYIKSYDNEYASNRITKPEYNLKYIYRIHEVIQDKDNINVMIPKNVSYINDVTSEYMNKRTKDRKLFDLQLLFKELEDDPNDPRSLYYIAQTYSCLEDYDKCYEYFLKRANHKNDGFIQEKIDAIFEAARLANFRFKKPWEECKKLYEWAYSLDNNRPDSLYFIGIHYYLEGDNMKAYEYFKQAFDIGYPIHSQYSLKPTLSFHFLPKMFTELCYIYKDYIRGYESSKLFCEKNDIKDPEYTIQHDWLNIFSKLLLLQPSNNPPIKHHKPVIVFCIDGNWKPWTGRDIDFKGLGGSETWAVETSRYLSKLGYIVHLFCKCTNEENYDGVEYHDISKYHIFIQNNIVDYCIISRYSEWVPMTYECNVLNVILWVHDLTPSTIVIPDNNKLKYIICLTEWHEKYMKSLFPLLEKKIKHHYYGIDVNKFNDINEDKIKHRFIYSSTANRGLINILNMWDRILEIFPNASLEVFCDLELQWANDAAPEDMKIIKSKINSKGVIYRGWQSKSELIRGWKRAEYWVYPCIFEETFCLTALEAALSKTIPITNGLAALQETAKYGVIIEGDPRSEEWQDNALEWIKKLDNDSTIKNRIIKENYEFAINSSWFEKTKEFVDKFNILNDDDIIMNKMSTLNYCNMYNWLHDLPKGQNSKEVFKNILMTFKDKRSSILEIGTFAGTSIIGMLNYLEDAKGFTIDKWEDYDENDIYYLKNISKLHIEDIFYDNVSKSNMIDRIKSVKGDSTECLIQLIKNNDLFDFIYVDGSHKCIDVYTDCMLSWKLLKEGGVMGIDDYLYAFNNCKELDIPYYGVNHFLEKIEGRYKLLNKGYRLFIVKQEERKNKTWVFYFEKDYNIKMVEQYLNNLKNKYKEYDILLTNDRSDIFKNNCVKITFVFNLHDKLIMDYCKLNNIELGYLNTEPLSSNRIVEIYKEYDKT